MRPIVKQWIVGKKGIRFSKVLTTGQSIIHLMEKGTKRKDHCESEGTVSVYTPIYPSEENLFQ